MAVASSENKALVASSEFDPSAFIKGIDAMTASLNKLSNEEDKIRNDLRGIDTAMKANRAEYKATSDAIAALDKTAKTYVADLAKLTTEQTNLKNQQKDLRAALVSNKDALNVINKSANEYKAALQGINAVSKQVASENKGRTLFDVASLNQQVQQVTALGGKLRNVFQGKISTAELDKFEASLAETKDEFKQLDQVITFVKSKLDTLDPDSQEFADLNQIIQTGEQVLQNYGETVENTDKKSVSLRTQLRLMREELARLEEAGQDGTKEFENLQVAAGRLQDQIGDTQQRIRVLSSDTKALDFGIGAIRGVASAFGVAEGAAALFGLKNEDVAKSLQRLNAIMLILNGLQEIQNLLQKQSVVAIVGQEIAAKGAAVAQRIYAFAIGTSTGALKAFRLALLATGIGAFIVLIGLAAEAMGAFGGDTEDATDKNKEFNDELARTNALLAGTQRFLKLDGQINEERLKRAGASEEKLQKARIDGLIKEKNALRESLLEIRTSQDNFLNQGLSGDFIDKSNADATAIANRIFEINDQITLEGEKALTKRTDDTKKALEKQRQLYEDFLTRVLDLQRELRDKLLEAQPQDEAAIRQQFTNSLSDAIADIDREVKSGNLTKGRADVLKQLIKQINTVDLTAALKTFSEEAIKAEQELANQLFDLRLQNGEERAELMRDQFTRESALVRINSRLQADQIKRERDEAIKNIQDTPFILPSVKAENIERIKLIYEQLLENLTTQTTRKQEEIAARVFESAQEDLQRIFSNVQLIVSESATEEILKASEQFQKGTISYEKYQKRLSEIAEVESRRRIATAIREQLALLAAIQVQIPKEEDPDRLKGLTDQERQIRLAIAELRRQLAAVDAEGTSKDAQERNNRIQELAKYAQAVGGIITQVVTFWQQVNEAEQRSLERSIALQERRVEAATKIAERGNSEYLRLEEDRLNELQTKQENAARRQLAINAVLQTSQALTAFVSALAQGIALGGPLGGIAIAGAVIAAIGAGYAIIQSLQKDTTQSFKGGTKSVKRQGEPAGIDTVPANLTEGEAVLPVDVNREYKPTVDAIFDKKIPAEVINSFVNNYDPKQISTIVNNYRTNQRVIPKLDHDRMAEAAEVRVVYDGQLLNATKEQTKKIEENSDLLARVEHRLKTMGVEVNLDRNGLAISLMKAVDQYKIDKRS